MSSSKIQEYNLDPNMGLAKEKSVQEILEKIKNTDKKGLRYLSASANTSTQTLFSVTGKGRLYFCILTQIISRGGTGKITVTVDGKAILTVSFKNTSTSSTRDTHVYIDNPIFSIESSNNNNGLTYPWAGKHLTTRGASSGQESKFLDEDSSWSITPSSTETYEYFYISDYIEFNESLEVKMTGCATDNDSIANICYSLEG